MQLVGHLHTILPRLRKVSTGFRYQRERLELEDGDFLLLDWLKSDGESETLVILCHGLEGSARSPYIRRTAQHFHQLGYDNLAWNLRSCGGEINRLLRFYHSGVSEDLAAVIDHVLAAYNYRRLLLVGFSVGGNILLKYLGERQNTLPTEIVKAAAVSPTVDLAACARAISRGLGKMYSTFFLRSIRKKIAAKRHALERAGLDTDKILRTRDIFTFDDLLTAPLHGFENALDYYHQASAIHLLDNIHCPSLILNSDNDPFLGASGALLSSSNPRLTVEVTRGGGHVGFAQLGSENVFYPAVRVGEFFSA